MKAWLFCTAVVALAMAALSSAQGRGLSAEALNLPLLSAVSLVGPDDSPAGANRQLLQDRLREHFARRMQTSLRFKSERTARMLARTLPGRIPRSRANTTVHFPDGSFLQVRAMEDFASVFGSQRFGFDPVTASVQAEGLPAVPQNAGQFERFSYSGDARTLARLAGLARRFGITTVASDANGRQAASSSMHCDGGDSEIRCTVRAVAGQRGETGGS